MEPRRPKWSPGGPNEAQEAQMEPRRPKWSPRGPNRAQEAQMEQAPPHHQSPRKNSPDKPFHLAAFSVN